MNDVTTTTPQTASSRPVLVWRPDADTTLIQPTVQDAAEFLKVSPDAVLAAIQSGDLLQGCFVDWDASHTI